MINRGESKLIAQERRNQQNKRKNGPASGQRNGLEIERQIERQIAQQSELNQENSRSQPESADRLVAQQVLPSADAGATSSALAHEAEALESVAAKAAANDAEHLLTGSR